MYTQNGKPINAKTGFMDGEIWRPYKLLLTLSAEDKEALGITQFVRPANPAPTLTQVVTKKIAEISNARDRADNGAFTFDGKIVDASAESRSKMEAITGLIALMGGQLPPGWVGGWKANDNTLIAIPDVATWISFFGAMVAQGQSNFVRSETRKAQVYGIADSELSDEEKIIQIQAVVWASAEELAEQQAEFDALEAEQQAANAAANEESQAS